MLKVFKVEVDLASEHRQALVELSEVRNVLVHRSGFADERFLAKCPWLKLSHGDRFIVTERRMDEYFDAAGKLAVSLIGGAVACPYIYRAPS